MLLPPTQALSSNPTVWQNAHINCWDLPLLIWFILQGHRPSVTAANAQGRSPTPVQLLWERANDSFKTAAKPNRGIHSLYKSHEQISSYSVMPKVLRFPILMERKGASDQLCLSHSCIPGPINLGHRSVKHVEQGMWLYTLWTTNRNLL